MTAANGHPNLVHARDVDAEEMDYGDMRCERRRLASAAGATAIGASLFTVPPDARQMPPHVHGDEEEIFFVLAGSRLLWQDGATHAVALGDTIVHRAGAAAHTLIAGGDGLTVLACGEGAATPVTYLPRTKAFWLGKRWLPADGPSPFRREVALGAMELPDAPEAQRPANVAHLDDIEGERVARGGLTYVAFGTRVPGDLCVFPRSGKVSLGGMTFRLEAVNYWEGEEDPSA